MSIDDMEQAANALFAALSSAGGGEAYVERHWRHERDLSIIDGRFDLRLAALAYLVSAVDAGLVSVDAERLAAWRKSVVAMRARMADE